MTNLLSLAPNLAMVVKLDELLNVLETTIIFVALGLIVFAIAFLIVVLVTPFSVKKEIEDDQNISLAVIIGSVIIYAFASLYKFKLFYDSFGRRREIVVSPIPRFGRFAIRIRLTASSGLSSTCR